MKNCWLLSRVQLFATPWIIACQVPLSLAFSRHCRQILYHLSHQGSPPSCTIVWKCESIVVQSWLTLWNPIDCSPTSSSVHGILQARVLEWVAIPFSRGYSWPRDRTQVSCIAGGFFMVWATRETTPWFIAIKMRLSLIPSLPLIPSLLPLYPTDCKQNYQYNIQHALLLQHSKGAHGSTLCMKARAHLPKTKWCPQRLLSTHPPSGPSCFYTGHLSYKDEMEWEGLEIPQVVKETLHVEGVDLASNLVIVERGNGSSCPGHWGPWSFSIKEGKQREATNWFSQYSCTCLGEIAPEFGSWFSVRLHF